jgi:sec-independent protein translocase protein TatA
MNHPPCLAFLGTTEIIVIGVLVLILFGAKKVPDLMKGVGTGIREFKRASREVHDQIEQVAAEPPPPTTGKKSNPTPTPPDQSPRA